MHRKKTKIWCWLWSLVLLISCSPQPSLPSPVPQIIEATPTPAALPMVGPSPTAVALSPTPAPTNPPLPPEQAAQWQHYPSLNGISDLAFSTDGASFGNDVLWAAIFGGIVRWDLNTDTPTHYTIPGGELSHVAHQLAISDAGIVWVATSSGVARFDGQTWTMYTSADGLPSDITYAIAIAPDGAIWAGTEKGLARFDGETWTTHAHPDLPNTVIWHIDFAPDDAPFGKGSLWTSTHGYGLLRYDLSANIWEHYSEETFPFPNARALSVAPNGEVWLHIGYDNVYRFDGETWHMAYESTAGRWVCEMAFGTPAAPYNGGGTTMPLLATCDGFHTYGSGLVYFNGTKWDYATMDDGLLRNNLTAIAIAPDGTIAAGTRQGISLYQDGRWRALRHGPTLSTITSVAITPDGAAWFGYGTDDYRRPGGGIARFDGETWHYDAKLPLSENARTLAVSLDGTLWAGGGCNVSRFVAGTWQSIATCDEVQGNVRHIMFAPNGNAWLMSDFGAYEFDGTNFVARGGKVPLALAVTTDGTVWMSHAHITGGGLATFDGTDWITQTDVPSEDVSVLVPMPDGGLMAYGSNGLMRYDGTTWTLFDVALPEDMGIGQLTVGPDGTLWGHSHGRLLHLDGERWQVIALPFEASIRAFSFAPDGTIWVGTDRGAVRYQP